MKFTKVIILLLGITFIFSCKSKEKVAEATTQSETTVMQGRKGATGQRPQMGERAGRGDWQARQEERQAKMYAELGVSDAQKAKMEVIQQSTRQKMQAMRSEASGEDRSVMREKMQAIRQAAKEEIKKILTAEQFTKYEKMLEEQRGRRG